MSSAAPRDLLRLEKPRGIDCDDKSRLWIVDAGHRRVVSLEVDGALHSIVGSARLYGPMGLCRTTERIYIADPDVPGVVAVHLAGAHPPKTYQDETRPHGVAVDEHQGTIFTSIPAAGVVLASEEAGRQRRLGSFEHPLGLALSPDRRLLFVADSAGSVSAVNVANGEQELLAKDLPDPRGLTVSPAGLLVATGSGHVFGINVREKTHSEVWHEPGACFEDVAYVRKDKTLVVTDSANHRLLRVARGSADASSITPRLPHLS